jgi:PAS domain S-box-containing protein
MAIVELDSSISMVNYAYCQLSGYSKDEAVGMNWTQQIPPDELDRLKEYNYRRLIDPQDPPDKYEFKFYKKGGEIRYALMSAAVLQRGKKIIASLIDITDRRQVREALRERNKELNTLYSISDIIEKKNTIEEVLRLSPDLIAQGFYHPEYACARITFVDQEFKTGNVNETSRKISADLILRGKPVGSVEVCYPCELPDRDEGPFSKEERKLLDSVAHRLSRFAERKKYEQERDLLISELQTALSEIKQLSGLLPICSSCKKVRNDNGYWEQIESYIRDHSQAEFSHGICPDCAKIIAANDHEQSSTGNVMGKVVILFVDDEKDFRVLFIRQLKRLVRDNEFEFIEARDAETALKLLKEGAKPSMIILDYALPEITGMELLRRIDADHPALRDVPRIMLSGYSHEQLKKEAQALRCAFLEKGIDIEKLCREIYRQMAISPGFPRT